jgi:hypothetical protein
VKYAPAADKPHGRLPSGPSPVQALVALRGEGRLAVWRTATVYEPQSYLDRGKPVTYYAAASLPVQEHYKLEAVRVFDAKGSVVDAGELPRLLKGETLVLVAADGRPVDPLHLRLVKEGTLVLVLPPPAVPPATVAPTWEQPMVPVGEPVHATDAVPAPAAGR